VWLLDLFEFLAGLAIVALTIRSAVRTLLVPRALQATFARVVFVVLRKIFGLRAGERHSYRMRDAVMAFYAPVALLTLLFAWMSAILLGYMLMFHAIGAGTLREAFAISGSSLLTLGFAVDPGMPELLLTFTEAAIGLLFLALVISYLPSLYGSFQRRERGVAELEVRAGQPPTGVYLLELAWVVGRHETLRDLWMQWEHWFTDVDESHSSYPTLVFFRSPHADQSWVTSAGAVLDAASLFASTVEGPRVPEAEFMIRSGYLCLRHIADFFQIPVDHDPRPDDPIRVAREEYDVAYDRLVRTGVPVRADRDQAWRDFAGWRVNYDAALIGLAKLTVAPWAPWSSDRYEGEDHTPPLLPRRLRR
jgi:hypothetical protein